METNMVSKMASVFRNIHPLCAFVCVLSDRGREDRETVKIISSR